ncbi:hypothetical protein MATL_G00026390 [Megalops atlanticus]|uniref:Uncharacterized protein n=1 Tax=Megalops atlanticus TaxID=7932 RepID=A0A9D3QC28_MEGAT|nr:hypothetical protein MATL_G00026390 [Megalops atlanticus]
MARNEEKHLGKLNRLWLQKEREEGRIKDVHEARPRLSSLNTAAAVKKWIPSIKNEIEYYLQQSQLSHYPERKIAEFQQHIEELGEEYKRYIRKLRFLDPSCRHHPWTPRAYAKKRREDDSPQCAGQTAKRLSAADHTGPTSQLSTECDGVSGRSGTEDPAASERLESSLPPAASSFSAPDLPEQDQPLSFDATRMAVKLAGSRAAPRGLPTDSMARVLLSGLPNLHSSPLAKTLAAQGGAGAGKGTTQPSDPSPAPQSTGNVLGLDCYSSSDEDT